MAAAKSKRQSRKRRRTGRGRRPAATGGRPAAPAVEARAEVPEPRRGGARDEVSVILTGRTYGEKPQSPFSPVPVAELAIFAGAVGAIVGFVSSAPAALATGLVVCTLGVAEFTAREHFSGYRSHAVLLAAIPAIGVGIAMIALVGGSLRRGPLLLIVVPVFLVGFWLLRRRFLAARQARIARPPVP